ncbi:3195_t:CDS:1, partial [Acaulospora colombiana]
MCIEKAESSINSKVWKYIHIWSTVMMFTGALILNIMVCFYFADDECILNIFFITSNVILCVIGVCLSIHPAVQKGNPRSGLSQASMVVLYCTYLVVSAVVNEPANHICNPLIGGHKARKTTIALGSMFTFLALTYSTSRTAIEGKKLMLGANHSQVRDNDTENPLRIVRANGEKSGYCSHEK